MTGVGCHAPSGAVVTGEEKMATAKKKTPQKEIGSVIIEAPKFRVTPFPLLGSSMMVQNKFAQEAQQQMLDAMMEDKATKAKKKDRPPKDLQKEYEGSMHKSTDGWYGIPATSFRNSLIRACKLVGIEMTTAKMCLFVEADGYEEDGTPLVRITKGKPHRLDSYVKNANGRPDIRGRGAWNPGWECTIRVKYDADFIKAEYVANLINRAGQQVGVGAGRPFSTMSNGMGWGTFCLKEADIRPSKKAA